MAPFSKLSLRIRPFSKSIARLRASLAAEANTVTEGMKAFAIARKAGNSFLLRRNTHRLEKGLSMPNRRKTFAGEFIHETVETYLRVVDGSSEATPSLRWSSDVLRAYFAAVDDSDVRVAKARILWNQSQTHDLPAETTRAGRVPRAERDLTDLRPSARGPRPDLEAFTRLCHARRSCRWFEDRSISMKTVRAAMSAALQAPSACNRQPFDFYAVTDKRCIAEIVALPLGTKGFGADLPCLIAVVGDLSAFSEPRDRHLIYIDSSLAVMSFMLALTSAGLASVPINWPDLPHNHEELRRILGLAPWQVPIMLIGLGYPDPDGMIAYSEKRRVDEVLHEF